MLYYYYKVRLGVLTPPSSKMGSVLVFRAYGRCSAFRLCARQVTSADTSRAETKHRHLTSERPHPGSHVTGGQKTLIGASHAYMKTVGNRNRNPELRSLAIKLRKARCSSRPSARWPPRAPHMRRLWRWRRAQDTQYVAQAGRPTKARCPGRP